MTVNAKRLSFLLPMLLLGVAGWVLWREFGGLDPARVAAQMAHWPPWRIAAAMGLTTVSFSLLATMEWLGLRWARARVPFRTALFGAFCSNAFAHTIGFAILIGGAIRARVYAPHGASLLQVAQTSLFCCMAFFFGISTLGGLTLLLSPELGLDGAHMNPAAVRGLALALLAAPAAYLAACALVRAPIRMMGREVALPPLLTGLSQVALGLVDNGVTAAVCWVLLPKGAVAFAGFAGAFVIATLTGLVSSVPGGAGVFEGAVAALLPGPGRAALAAAFVGYRLFYFLAPLGLASLIEIRSGLAFAARLFEQRRLTLTKPAAVTP